MALAETLCCCGVRGQRGSRSRREGRRAVSGSFLHRRRVQKAEIRELRERLYLRRSNPCSTVTNPISCSFPLTSIGIRRIRTTKTSRKRHLLAEFAQETAEIGGQTAESAAVWRRECRALAQLSPQCLQGAS
eukprot:scaffold878_cov271-Pinguiococcus_pyrenoidosus.AAC.51